MNKAEDPHSLPTPPTSVGAAPPAATPAPVGPGTAALALLTSALWGGTPTAIRFATDSLPPVMVAAIRFGLAALFMLFWIRWEGVGLQIRRDQWRPILGASLLLFVQIVTFNWGVAGSNSSHGSLFINTFLFWVGPIEHFITRTDRLTLRKTLGLVLAGLASLGVLAADGRGTSLASVPRDEVTLAGDLVLLLSGLLLGIKIVYTKLAVRRVEPGKLIFWHDVFGTALFLVYSGMFETTSGRALTAPAIWGLLYQGILVGGFCFAIQAVQLKHHSASQIAVFSAATPLFGIVFGWWLRGDPLSWWLLAASAGVGWGILLVTRAATKARAAG
ncbi:MAG: DMT family transporter [Planctomycetaceae bacterium]|jgi:drug/metabolite transporter (DMT)-like permease